MISLIILHLIYLAWLHVRGYDDVMVEKIAQVGEQIHTILVRKPQGSKPFEISVRKLNNGKTGPLINRIIEWMEW
jgi:hypothetical protein